MDEELTWEVRARFYWREGGQVVRSAEFTQSELEVECERLSEAGKDIMQFALALLALTNSNMRREDLAFDGADQRWRA